jgi:hypothetical protein
MQAVEYKARIQTRFFELWFARVSLWAHPGLTEAEPVVVLAFTVVVSVFKCVVRSNRAAALHILQSAVARQVQCINNEAKSCSPGGAAMLKFLSASDKLVKALMITRIPEKKQSLRIVHTVCSRRQRKI